MQTNVSGLANPPNHQLAITLLMTPDMANFMGNAHGGTILKLLDQVGLCLCQPDCRGLCGHLISRSSHNSGADHVGELVTFLAAVNYTGNSSLEIGIKVIAEDIRSHIARHANRCYFTMVAVDEAGKPTAVPPFKPSTANEHRRFEEAKLRKALRRELAARHRAMKHPPLLLAIPQLFRIYRLRADAKLNHSSA